MPFFSHQKLFPVTANSDPVPDADPVDLTFDSANMPTYGVAQALCTGGATMAFDVTPAAGGSAGPSAPFIARMVHNNSSNALITVNLVGFVTIDSLEVVLDGINEAGELPLNWSLPPDSYATSGNDGFATWNTSLAGLTDLNLTFEMFHPRPNNVSSLIRSVAVSGTAICP